MAHPNDSRLWLVGGAVRAIRQARGISGQDLARQVGISHAYLSLMELQDRQPSPPVLMRLAQALALPVGAITMNLERIPADKLRGGAA
jgi:transcriptional regulator with XRE-family HTH domain